MVRKKIEAMGMKLLKNTIKPAIFASVVTLIVVMAYATFIEQKSGHAQAEDDVYHSFWFRGLWLALSVLLGTSLYSLKMHRRVAVCLLHCSILLIVAGGAVSFFHSKSGTIHLREGIAKQKFWDEKSRQWTSLPFSITLQKFNIEYYLGTQAPKNFISRVNVSSPERQASHTIGMNKILRHDNYRFYQSSFDADGKGTILKVTYDPWGIFITYCGFALFALSFLLTLTSKKESFRRLLSHSLPSKQTAVILLSLSSLFPLNSEAHSVPTVTQERAEQIARMPIVYNNRIAPFNTMARDFIVKLYGKPNYKGLSAEQIILGWLSHPEVWKNEKILKISNKKLRQDLGIKGKYASLAELFNQEGEYKLNLLRTKATQDKNGKAFQELDEKVGLVLLLTKGELFKPVPQNAPAPGRLMIEAEILYNKIPFTTIVFACSLAFGLLMFVVMLLKTIKTVETGNDRFHKFCKYTVFSITTFHLLGYALRWIVGGRIPLSNSYETMLFMASAVLLFTAFTYQRFTMTMPLGLLLTGIILFVVQISPTSAQISPLMPVLQSSMLSIHVCFIMFAYTLLAFITMNGIFTLILSYVRHNHHSIGQLTAFSRLMLFPATYMLSIGIFLGAIWGNISWGSYWAWDPKETWALITLMIYAIPLHKSIKKLSQPTYFHVYTVAAFLAVLMTYFGVNHFLGGMHSYA